MDVPAVSVMRACLHVCLLKCCIHDKRTLYNRKGRTGTYIEVTMYTIILEIRVNREKCEVCVLTDVREMG